MNRHLIRRWRRSCGSGVKSRSKMCNSISNMIVVQNVALHSYVPLLPPSSDFADGVLSCSTSVIWFCLLTFVPCLFLRTEYVSSGIYLTVPHSPLRPSLEPFPLNRFIVSEGHKVYCSLERPSWAIAIRPPSSDALPPIESMTCLRSRQPHSMVTWHTLGLPLP